MKISVKQHVERSSDRLRRADFKNILFIYSYKYIIYIENMLDPKR